MHACLFAYITCIDSIGVWQCFLFLNHDCLDKGDQFFCISNKICCLQITITHVWCSIMVYVHIWSWTSRSITSYCCFISFEAIQLIACRWLFSWYGDTEVHIIMRIMAYMPYFHKQNFSWFLPYKKRIYTSQSLRGMFFFLLLSFLQPLSSPLH